MGSTTNVISGACGRFAAAVVLAAAGIGALPISAGATPVSVTIAGSLQSELGCSGDWQPDCATTHLTYDANDDVWQGAFPVPAGNWEYKAALNDSWDVNYGVNAQANGANISLSLAGSTTVKFYYDDKSHWVADNHNSRIVVAAGSFQSELGCVGDWDPGCLRSWLQDIDGDGTYEFFTTALPIGNYDVKAAIDESWDENYGQGATPGGLNIAFNVPLNNIGVRFLFLSSENLLTVEVDSVPAPAPSTIVLLGIGLAGLGLSGRRK